MALSIASLPLKQYGMTSQVNQGYMELEHGNTVKSHVKALSLYNFIWGFGWAYKQQGGLYLGGRGD